MDIPQKVMSSLKKGRWVCSLDLKDAYLQVPIPISRKNLRMEIKGQSISAHPSHCLFIRISGVVKEIFHKDGLSLFQYLDDWLGDTQSKSQAQARCDWLVRLCTHLGFLIKIKKSEVVPTEMFHFIGMHFDLCLGNAYITVKNCDKVLSAVELMIQRD